MKNGITTVLILGALASPAMSLGGGGGDSHSGGGSILNHRVDLETMHSFLLQSRAQLLAYFNYKSMDPRFPFPEIFREGSSILEAIHDFPLTPQAGPCTPVAGHEDGSASFVSGVCISEDRLMDLRMVKKTYVEQVLALVAHEYAHLSGFDEADAVRLQVYVEQDLDVHQIRDPLSDIPYLGLVYGMRFSQEKPLLEAENELRALSANLAGVPSQAWIDSARKVESLLTQVQAAIPRAHDTIRPFSGVSREGAAIVRTANTRAFLLLWGLTSLYDKNVTSQNEALFALGKIFGSSESISVNEALRKVGGDHEFTEYRIIDRTKASNARLQVELLLQDVLRMQDVVQRNVDFLERYSL